jgi:hypothetical protein
MLRQCHVLGHSFCICSHAKYSNVVHFVWCKRWGWCSGTVFKGWKIFFQLHRLNSTKPRYKKNIFGICMLCFHASLTHSWVRVPHIAMRAWKINAHQIEVAHAFVCTCAIALHVFYGVSLATCWEAKILHVLSMFRHVSYIYMEQDM